MLLRKLVAALCPLLLCMLTCVLFRLLDSWLGASSFFSFLLKGLLLGACLSLVPPLAGIKSRNNGLTAWLFAGAGLLLCMLLYQYLETIEVLHSPLLLSLITINAQVVLVESTVMGFLVVTGLMNRKR
ncbi:MAG: hypothetical protein RSB06_02385 [Clostridia bacterium]